MLLFSVDFKTTQKAVWVILGEEKGGGRQYNVIVDGLDDFFKFSRCVSYEDFLIFLLRQWGK